MHNHTPSPRLACSRHGFWTVACLTIESITDFLTECGKCTVLKTHTHAGQAPQFLSNECGPDSTRGSTLLLCLVNTHTCVGRPKPNYDQSNGFLSRYLVDIGHNTLEKPSACRSID